MAIDTKAKRASVQAYTPGLMRPPPDGTISEPDWATVAGFYAGLDYTGTPFVATTRPGWFSFHNAFHEAEFMTLMRAEAEGSKVWTRWATGVDLPSNPVPKNTANLEFDYDHFYIEANTDKVWCRWAPGTQPGNEGNAEINLQVGEQVDFV